jgi:hypothetical protein
MPRCLIVANQTLTSASLRAEIRARDHLGGYQFHLVVPATHLRAGIIWTEGQAIALARSALDQTLRDLHHDGIDATGEIGDDNPILAVSDALNQHSFDEIIVSTLPPGISRWLKQDLPHRLARRFRLPVTHSKAGTQPGNSQPTPFEHSGLTGGADRSRVS